MSTPKTRRQFIQDIGKLSLAASLYPSLTACSAPSSTQSVTVQSNEVFKTVIKNGEVFTGDKIQPVFVGITEKGTLKISDVPLIGKQEIDAKGKIVSPGFIDILGDDAFNPQQTYRTFEKYKLSDGLTTVLQMHGGSEDPTAYHQFFDRKSHVVNYGVSTFVMRIRSLYKSEKERLKYVEKMLAEGVLGVSHSLEYQPTPYPEVQAYAKLAKQYNRPMFLHLRYSSRAKELDGVKEAIQLAKETGVRLHIDHLHSTGGTWAMPQALNLIEKANATGSEITCCIYPYTYWATYVHSKRFDPGWREMYGLDYKDLQLAGTNFHLTESAFNLYRRKVGYLVSVPEGTMPFKTTIDLALQTNFCMIGSDGGIISETDANSHPRGAGCFATAIRHALDINMPLEKILPKMTTLPARLLRPALNNRGEIKDGYVADITIFDPKTIRGKGTVANPNQFSDGIETVILGGEIVFQQGKILASQGKPIRLSTKSL